MDAATLAAYESRAAEFCSRYERMVPTRLYELAQGFFAPGRDTVDIGCGSGRDACWLSERGFPTAGYDASRAMLAQARARHPGVRFGHSALPDLPGIHANAFCNVFCSAVLMHLPREDLLASVLALSRILQPDGRLLLSWRGGDGPAARDEDGRLFADIAPGKLALMLESAGLHVTHSDCVPDPARHGVLWHVVLARKAAEGVARGLDRVQSILAQDRKVATYKLALVRALCEISRAEPHIVVWRDGVVHVPLRAIAVQWLAYYWPQLAPNRFVAQMGGEHRDGGSHIAFRSEVERLHVDYKSGGLYFVLRQLDENPAALANVLGKIARTIKVGPVTYAGTKARPVFAFVKEVGARDNRHGVTDSLGWVAVPEPVWLDISRYSHWIEDSVVVRWARLLTLMNPGSQAGDFLQMLVSVPGEQRATEEARQILISSGLDLRCVWTRAPLAPDLHDAHIDHTIPIAVWGNNDLWNMLPSTSKCNLAKSDKIPSLALVREQQDLVVGYWRAYRDASRQRFDVQIARSLGCTPGGAEWERVALAGLMETLQRIKVARGMAWWP